MFCILRDKLINIKHAAAMKRQFVRLALGCQGLTTIRPLWFSQGQKKPRGNLAHRCVWPFLSLCIVSSRTYRPSPSLDGADIQKKIPSPGKNNSSVAIAWIVFIGRVWRRSTGGAQEEHRRRTGARVSSTAAEATAVLSAQRGTLPLHKHMRTWLVSSLRRRRP